jgi:hypothetical protein
MSLFAILGIPCFTLFILSAADRRTSLKVTAISAQRRLPALQFIKGFFYAIPCLVVILILRRFVPLSYRHLPLYVYYLFTDHLIPIVFLVVLYFLAYSQKTFRELLLFGGGFYTLIGIVEIFSQYGQYEPYLLFLLPAVRMAVLLFVTIFFLRYQQWYGVVRVLFLILLLFVPFLSAAITYLYMRAYLLWAGCLTVLLFLGSLVYTFLERDV